MICFLVVSMGFYFIEYSIISEWVSVHRLAIANILKQDSARRWTLTQKMKPVIGPKHGYIRKTDTIILTHESFN